jgi:hypothetical protein
MHGKKLHITTGNAWFANSLELLAKTPTLLAKAFPTGFPSSCWERTIGVLSDGKELFANRNAGPIGKASPTATCTVGEGGTPSARLPLRSPTGKRRLSAKSGWQSWEFFPLFFCCFLAFNSHIKSTHQHMNQNTTYINNIAYEPHFGIGFDLNMNPHIKSIDTCP